MGVRVCECAGVCMRQCCQSVVWGITHRRVVCCALTFRPTVCQASLPNPDGVPPTWMEWSLAGKSASTNRLPPARRTRSSKSTVPEGPIVEPAPLLDPRALRRYGAIVPAHHTGLGLSAIPPPTTQQGVLAYYPMNALGKMSSAIEALQRSYHKRFWYCSLQEFWHRNI